jgi:hypothetical protein
LCIFSGASQDSGLGSSTQDVIVFGSGIQNDDAIARSKSLIVLDVGNQYLGVGA